MTTEITYPRIINEFDERDDFELPRKGWWGGTVQLANGNLYTLIFYDLGRLNQNVEEEFKEGKICHAEENIIIVPEVNVEAIRNAVSYLFNRGFFNYLKPDSQAS